MKIKKPLHIYDEVFKHNYYVSYGVPKDYFLEQIQKYCPEMYEGKGMTLYAGRCMTVKKLTWVWTLKKRIDILAHELVHAITHALYTKMPLRFETEETYAYLLEMLMRKILERSK